MLIEVNLLGFQGQTLERRLVEVETTDRSKAERAAFRFVNNRRETGYNEIAWNTAERKVTPLQAQTIEVLERLA